MMLSCSFTVEGVAVPQGSMRGFVRGGRAVLTSDNPNLSAWRKAVAGGARIAMLGRPEPYAGSVEVALGFYLPRPVSHFLPVNSRRAYLQVRPGAPAFPAGRPDLDKLVRAILDAMTGIVFADDGQVVALEARKHYTDHRPPRVVIYAFGE